MYIVECKKADGNFFYLFTSNKLNNKDCKYKETTNDLIIEIINKEKENIKVKINFNKSEIKEAEDLINKIKNKGVYQDE